MKYNDLLVIDIKRRKLDTAISFALSNQTRAVIVGLAERENLSLGEAARELLDAGIAAKGLEC